MKKINRLFIITAFIMVFISLPVTCSAKTIKRTLKKGKSSVVTVTTKKVKKLEVKSSNQKVAAVKKVSGKKIRISAKKTGKAKITAKIYKNKKQYSKNVYQITVKASASADNEDDEPGIVPKKSHRRPTKATPVPLKKPQPNIDPAATVTPQVTKVPEVSTNYTYDLMILNKCKYNNSQIYVYTKTNNPYGNSMKLEGFNTSVATTFDDVHYDKSENINWNVGKKVAGGYLAVVKFDNPGNQILTLTEIVNNTSSVVASLELELSDYENATKEFADDVIAWAEERVQDCNCLVENILDGKRENSSFQISSVLGYEEADLLCEGLYNHYDNWNEYSCIPYQELQEYMDLPYEVKLSRMIGAYIYKNYRYQTYTDEEGELYLLSECSSGLWWTQGSGLNCWDATALLELVLTEAKISMEWGIPENNPMHRYGIIRINGQEYIVDAQPRMQTGLLLNWTYVI